MATQLPPGKAKYSVSVVQLGDLHRLPDEPDTKPTTQRLVSEQAMRKAFDSFPAETRGTGEVRHFVPFGKEAVRVYFKPGDLNSLHYFVTSREEGDDYAASIGLDKPFNVPRYDRRDRRRYPY